MAHNDTPDIVTPEDRAAMALYTVGARLRLRIPGSIFNVADIPEQALGTAVEVNPDANPDGGYGEPFALVRFDQRVPDLDEWDNCVQVYLSEAEITPAAFEAAPADAPPAPTEAEEQARRIETIAELFASNLKDGHLSPLEWDRMRDLNRDDTTHPDACHSHDFCDANMVMKQAMETVLGRSILPDETQGHDPEMSDADVALWNAAWAEAKKRYLTAPAPDGITEAVDLPADPGAYRVEYLRAHGTGPLIGARIALAATGVVVHDVDAEALDSLLRAAREVESGNPYDDKVPAERAVAIAFLMDAGIPIPDRLMTLTAPHPSPTRNAIATAIAALTAAGWPPRHATIAHLQAILDQQGCEHFDAAGDGSLTDLIDIIING